MSTTSVSGYYLVRQNIENQMFTENDFYIGQRYYENVYVRSKFEAENLILQFMAEGLNATIHRIGVLSGRYTDGKFQPNIYDNALYNRLRSILQMGFVQEDYSNLDLEFSPVDYCSRAIVMLSLIEESNQHVFHILNHNTMRLSDFIIAAYKCGYPIEIMAREDYEERIKRIHADPFQQELLTGIINDVNMSRSKGGQSFPIIESRITVEYLRQLGFEWPVISNEYIQRIISYMESTGFIDKEGGNSRHSLLRVKG